MKLVVTGSIAFDYLMSFPGKFTDHLLAEHMHRVSLSFLVDTMDKRRGGCAPNIAYTLSLLGERPMLMATAGQDFSEYRAWLDAHVPQLLALPGFVSAEVFEVLEPVAAGRAGLCVQYRLRDAAALEAYLRKHAPHIRAEGLARFGERVRANRRVLRAVA